MATVINDLGTFFTGKDGWDEASLPLTAWDHVKAQVERLGGVARLSTFDGGQTVRVTIPGEPYRAITSYWGDDLSAAEAALEWLNRGRPASFV